MPFGFLLVRSVSRSSSSVLSSPARLKALRDAVRPRAYPALPYDSLTRVAACALDVPVVLVALVDDQGQFFQGMTGLVGKIAICRSTPLSDSICRFVVSTGEVLGISDCRVHPLTCLMPIIEELGIVGYMGMPLKTSDGHTLGSICAITTSVRAWTPSDDSLLRDLAEVVVSDLELRAELTHHEDRVRDTDLSVVTEGLPAHGVAMLDTMLEGVVALDRQWNITFANRTAARILYQPRRRFVGKAVWEALPVLVGTEIESVLRAASVDRRALEVDTYLPGPERWGRVRVVPARHGLTVYFEDTTASRRAMEALALREDQLRQSQKMEAIGVLAGGIAHDFNNLLTVVRANSEILLSGRAHDDAARAPLEDIQDAAARATTLTQQLLAFGRKQIVQPRYLQVGQSVESLAPMLRRLLPANISLETHAEAGVPTVLIDPGQMEQVMLNLVLNARDALPQGGSIVVRSATVHLAQSISSVTGEVPAGDWMLLTVQDTGVGILPEHLWRVFEPFFTTKPMGEGTGLGLATVFGIVRDAGGFVTVQSAPAAGSRFRVYLPISALDLAPAAVATAPVIVPQGTECILVVEDEAPVRGVVERVLTSAGYSLLLAKDGIEAQAVFAAHRERIQLVLTDVVMPNAGGLALVEALHAIAPSLPVVLMSGYGDVEPIQQQIAKGLSFLAKPFSAVALREAVRTALDGRLIAEGAGC